MMETLRLRRLMRQRRLRHIEERLSHMEDVLDHVLEVVNRIEMDEILVADDLAATVAHAHAKVDGLS